MSADRSAPAASRRRRWRRIRVSFEFFPPKTEEMEKTLWETITRLAPLEPQFRLGDLRRRRLDPRAHRTRPSSASSTETALTPAAHLTCVDATATRSTTVIRSYSRRGRAPHRGAARRSGRRRRRELRAASRRLCATAPSWSPASSASATSRCRSRPIRRSIRTARLSQADIDMLKRKVDDGATRAITQFFFENDLYFRYLDRVRARGINIPIVPGILPVQNFKQVDEFRRALRRAGAGLAGRALRRARRRPATPQAGRRRGRRRAGARPGRARRHRFPLLHHEPRRPGLRGLPSARPAARARKRARVRESVE